MHFKKLFAIVVGCLLCGQVGFMNKPIGKNQMDMVYECDGLYDEEILQLYESASNEPSLGMDYLYAPHYFSNLRENFGNNYVGSCGYVATGMLLSFWDTYWDDNIIPENYDMITLLDEDKLSYDLESPGIYRENEILNGVSVSDYYKIVEKYSNAYFHLFLIKMGKEIFGQYNFDSESPAGMTYTDYVELFNYYVYNYRGYSSSDVEVLAYKGTGSGADCSKSVRDYAIELVQRGIPVKLGIGRSYGVSTHAVVAYDYDAEKDELYCHFGWGERTTHVTIESQGYISYSNALAFNFKNAHNHSNNYKYSNEYDVATHCSCHYVIPYHVNLIDGYRDLLPTYKWNCLNREKWFIDQDLKYKFKILDQNRHAIFTITTQTDDYQLTREQWNKTLELPNGKYYAYVEPYSDVYPYWDDYGYAEFFTTTSNFKNAYIVRPADYGFADAYPIDSSTMNNYITHTVNGFSFQTRRYRTGYIQGEYVVLSPIRNNINEAYIEYKFDVPVLKIDVQLTHWRGYSSERLSRSNGTFALELYTDDGWTATYDLLSSSYNLPTDRTSPNWYTFEFEQPVYEFRFHATSSLVYTSENNRGRVCIGDLAIWTHLPLSGYELEYDESLWDGVPSWNNNCYAYALNNQINPSTNSIWYKQQPGELGGKRYSSFAKSEIVSAVEKDFEAYNRLYSTHTTDLIFKEVGRFDVCPKGTYKVALVSYSGDYHWYRQNADGTWSHKPGTTPVRNYDNSGKTIVDPQFCDRGSYVDFLGYFAVTPWGNMYNA